MHPSKYFLFLLAVIASLNESVAQPFTLDKDIKPLEIKLEEYTKLEGAKGRIVNTTIKPGDTHYFYVTGHDMFQLIDVYIFGSIGSPMLSANIAKDSWEDVKLHKDTKESEEGVINFKLRDQEGFGLMVASPGEVDAINYTIVVMASPPVKTHLGSPFVKASKSDLEGGGGAVPSKESDAPRSSGNESSNLMLILLSVALGVALLVAGLLLWKTKGRKTTQLVLLMSLICPGAALSQSPGETTFHEIDLTDQIDRLAVELYVEQLADVVESENVKEQEFLRKRTLEDVKARV